MSKIYIFRKRISFILWMHGLTFPQVLFFKIGIVSFFTSQIFKYWFSRQLSNHKYKYFKTFSLLLTYFLVISRVQWIFLIFGAKLECFFKFEKTYLILILNYFLLPQSSGVTSMNSLALHILKICFLMLATVKAVVVLHYYRVSLKNGDIFDM